MQRLARPPASLDAVFSGAAGLRARSAAPQPDAGTTDESPDGNDVAAHGTRATPSYGHTAAIRPKIVAVSLYAAPLIDALAAGCSLGAVLLPEHAIALGTASGILWAVSGGVHQLANVPAHHLSSTANGLGALAGLLSTPAAIVHGHSQIDLSYAYATAWGLNGFSGFMRAASSGDHHTASKILLSTSGAANIGAAVMAALACKATADGDSDRAVYFGALSAGLWLIGSVTAFSAACTEGCSNRRSGANRRAPTQIGS